MARKLLFKLLYLSSLPALGSLNTPLLPVAFAKESYFGASVMACPGFEDSMSCWVLLGQSWVGSQIPGTGSREKIRVDH